jgi:hypothetical protein
MTVLKAMAGMVDTKAEQEKLDLAAEETKKIGDTNTDGPQGEPTA